MTQGDSFQDRLDHAATMEDEDAATSIHITLPDRIKEGDELWLKYGRIIEWLVWYDGQGWRYEDNSESS